MRYLGILLTLAIIAVATVWLFKSFGMTNNSADDVGSMPWYYAHQSERADKLQWCNQNPQQQDSTDCRNATAAQTQVDLEKTTKQQ